MILKVKTEFNGREWFIFDDIREVSTGVFYPYVSEEDQCINDKVDDINLRTDYSEKDVEYHFVRLICRNSKGDEFTVAFDTVAYLCNDEGKTIEKIVP